MASFMTGRTKLMIALAAAGVATGAFFLLRDGDEAGATRTAHQTAQPDRDVPTTPDGARVPVRDRANDRRVPSGPDGLEEGDAADKPPVTYLEDGTRVTDHRSKASQYLRPGVGHPSKSPVDGKISTEVLHLIRPIVLGCLAGVPDDAFADDAVVMARADITIDAQGNLTATDLGADGTGLDDAKLQPAIDCIRAAAPSVTAHVDHAAVETVSLAFPIRPLAYRR